MPIPRGFTKIFGSDPSKMTKEGARKIVDAFKTVESLLENGVHGTGGFRDDAEL